MTLLDDRRSTSLSHQVRRLAVDQVGLTVVTVVLGLLAIRWPLGHLDGAILLVFADRVRHGELPYHDFATVYGPVHWLALGGWFAAFGSSVVSERFFGLAEHLGLVLGTYAVLRRDGRGVAVVGGLLASVLLFPLGLEAYAWLGVAALTVWGLAALRPEVFSSRRAFRGGLAGALAVGFRPDAALLVVAPSLVLLRGRGRWRAWWAGAALGTVPSLVVVAGAVHETFHDLLSRSLHGAQARLPLPLHDPKQRLVVLGLLVTVAVLALAAARSRNRFLIAVAVLALMALPQGFQRAETIHFLYAALVALPFAPLALARLLPSRGPLAGALAAVLMLLVAQESALPRLAATVAGRGPAHTTVHVGSRSLPDYPSVAPETAELMAAIARHWRPGDEVFVWDQDTRLPSLSNASVYWLLPERQHAWQVELSPGLSNTPGSRLEVDVERADLLVLERVAAARRAIINPHEQPGPDLAQQLIGKEFCVVEQVGSYDLMRRC